MADKVKKKLDIRTIHDDPKFMEKLSDTRKLVVERMKVKIMSNIDK